jgi:hypothetical protein
MTRRRRSWFQPARRAPLAVPEPDAKLGRVASEDDEPDEQPIEPLLGQRMVADPRIPAAEAATSSARPFSTYTGSRHWAGSPPTANRRTLR